MNESGTDRKTLLIGIGNSGRSDDALGWKFVDEFVEYGHLFDLEYRYQLQIEDAELHLGLSAEAQQNFNKAANFFRAYLQASETEYVTQKISSTVP